MLCRSHDPLDHIIAQELLYNRSLSVDGSAIEATGFKYTVAEPTVQLLREVNILYSMKIAWQFTTELLLV